MHSFKVSAGYSKQESEIVFDFFVFNSSMLTYIVSKIPKLQAILAKSDSDWRTDWVTNLQWS